MDELDKLFQQVLAAQHEGHSDADINRVLAERTAFPSVTALKAALHDRDMAPDAPNAVAGAAESFGRGASLGFSDELSGVASAVAHPLHPVTAYQSGRDEARQQYAAFDAAHPILSSVAQGAGGLASGIATGDLLPTPAASYGGKILQGLGIGAGFGATQAVGDNMDHDKLLSDIARGAAFGGAGGAAVGALLPPALSGLGALYRGGRAIFAPAADASAAATGILSRSLPADAETQLTQLGPQGLLADVVPKLQDVARGRSLPVDRATADLLDARSGSAGPALAQSLAQNATGQPAIDMVEALTQADASKRRAALALYGPLEQQYPSIPSTPAGKALMKLAFQNPEIATTAAKTLPRASGGASNFAGFQSTLQELEDRTSEAFRAGRGNEGDRLRDATKTLRTAMESAFPGFREANQQYVPIAEVSRALQEGPEAFGMDARMLQKRLNGFRSEEGQSAFRAAAIDALAAKLTNQESGSVYRQALVRGNQSIEPHLRVLFGNEEGLQNFLNDAQTQRAFERTANVMGGSKTAGTAALAADVFQSPGLGNAGLGTRLSRALGNAAFEGREGRVAQALSDRLLTSGPAARDVLASVAQARAREALRNLLETHAIRGLAATPQGRTGAGLAAYQLGQLGENTLARLGL